MRKKPNAFTRKKRKAFALAESIIALLILAIALLAMALVPIMSSKLALQTVQKEQAMTLAMDRLNILEATPFADSVNSTDVEGAFTVVYKKSARGDVGTVSVTWGGITGNASLTLTRNLSEAASKVAQK